MIFHFHYFHYFITPFAISIIFAISFSFHLFCRAADYAPFRAIFIFDAMPPFRLFHIAFDIAAMLMLHAAIAIDADISPFRCR
jgi:hypothetical protein